MLAQNIDITASENKELQHLRGISLDQFLAYTLEHSNDYQRWEYIAGTVYGMAGGSDEHSQLCVSLTLALGNHLPKRGPCRVFDASKDIVKDPERAPQGKGIKGAYFQADVSVQCRNDHGGYDPLIVVEVLSESTERKDRTEKLPILKMMPSVREVLLVNQFTPLIEVYSRVGDVFVHRSYVEGQSFVLESIALEVSVDAIYEGILPE